MDFTVITILFCSILTCIFILLIDGIGASDFGESLRFQKVLQGQEILGFDTPFDGIGMQNLHPSETRRGYPGPSSSGIAAIGNIVRNPHVNSDNISSKGIGFGESFRFHKVLQGQEIYPSSPCGRAPAANEANQYGGLGIYDGVQVPDSRNGWSTLMQSNNAHVRSSSQSVQVSSPSSVLMFQHAMNPVSNFNSIYNSHNQEDQRSIKRSSYMPESNDGKYRSSFCNSIFSGEDHGGRKSMCSLSDHIQQEVSNPQIVQSTHRSSQDVVASCKSSCRLFGFSLTEEKHVPDKECNSTVVTSPLNAGASLFPNVAGQFHSKPPLMAKAVGSNCTKVSKSLLL